MPGSPTSRRVPRPGASSRACSAARSDCPADGSAVVRRRSTAGRRWGRGPEPRRLGVEGAPAASRPGAGSPARGRAAPRRGRARARRRAASRTARRASSASAWRPARVRARAWSAHHRSCRALVADARLGGRQHARVLAERQQPEQPGLLRRRRAPARARCARPPRRGARAGRRTASPVQVPSTASSSSRAATTALRPGQPGAVAGRELGGQRRQHALEPAYVGDEPVRVDVLGSHPQHVAVVGRLRAPTPPSATCARARGPCAARRCRRAARRAPPAAARPPRPGRPAGRPTPACPRAARAPPRSSAVCARRRRATPPPARPRAIRTAPNTSTCTRAMYAKTGPSPAQVRHGTVRHRGP